MAWNRLGRTWGPDGSKSWANSHTANPVAYRLGTSRVRVFFGTRNIDNISSIGHVDADLPTEPGAPMTVTEVGEQPLLSPRQPGSFDDRGLGMGSIVTGGDGADRLYFMGWNLGVDAPWRNSIGVAEGDASGPSFRHMYDGPLLDRSIEDPYTLSYPWVLRLAEDDWRMWYGSNIAWGAQQADMQHIIRHARSRDGLAWERSSEPALSFEMPGEYAMARPCVVPEGDGFGMWFTTRGPYYRVGSAWSPDGINWTRRDATHGLDRAEEKGEWDGEMTCYPCVFRHGERLLMLYNGNGYGREGFGLAEWDGEQ